VVGPFLLAWEYRDMSPVIIVGNDGTASPTTQHVQVMPRLAWDDDKSDFGDAFRGGGLSLAYNRPRVYGSSQLFEYLYYR
jgi:hypothetical protein